ASGTAPARGDDPSREPSANGPGTRRRSLAGLRDRPTRAGTDQDPTLPVAPVTVPPGRVRGGIDQLTLERVGLLAIIAVAAILRFVDLPTRGTFDADQGHDMLVLHDLVASGQIPLLGPPTSIGDFHHGVLSY